MTVETIQTNDIENPIYSIVIPLRNRYGHMLRNCLRSITLQTIKPVELIIVDYGSTPENHEKLLEIIPPCTLYRYKTQEPWSLAAARNLGLRRAKAPLSGALDADLIMEPQTLELAIKIHRDYGPCYLTSRVILLSPNAITPSQIELPRDYNELVRAPVIKRAEGWGGFTSAPAEWWFRCQGFDERMKWWGWEDVDMWKRVARAKLARNTMQGVVYPDSEIYHQYHPNFQVVTLKQGRTEIHKAIVENERYTKQTRGILRNDENWGLWSED